MGVAVVTAGLTIIISEQFGAPGCLPPVLDIWRSPAGLLSEELGWPGRRRREGWTGEGRWRGGGAGELPGRRYRGRGGAGSGDGCGGHRRGPHSSLTCLAGSCLTGC